MEFKRLADVDVVETATDTANVLIEEDGSIKRVPKTEVGGAGGVATAIIKSSDYINRLASMQTDSSSASTYLTVAPTYTCDNMTFEEACQIILNGQPLTAYVMFATDVPVISPLDIAYVGDFIVFSNSYDIMLFWTIDGISTTEPSGEPK